MVEGRVMESHMDDHNMEEVKLSNDMREAIKTRCLLCQEVFTVNSMRSHVKQKHQIIITEYKERQLKGAPYKLQERVYHRCKFYYLIFKTLIYLPSNFEIIFYAMS